ncbi:MAG: methyl-accepting chemotaxis protein [Elusimicrobiota bacterium]
MNNIKIGKKLFIGFGAIAFIGLIVGIIGLYEIRKIDKLDTFLYEKGTVLQAGIADLRRDYVGRRQRVYMAIAYKGQAEADNIIKEINEKTQMIKEKTDSLIKEFDESNFHYINYNGSKVKIEGKFGNDEIFKELQAFKKNEEAYVPLMNSAISMVKNNRSIPEILGVLKNGGSIINASLDSLNKMIEVSIKMGKNIADSNTETANKTFWVLSIIIIIGILLSVFAAFYITKSIIEPLKMGVDMMSEFSKGHLDKRLNLDRKDEVGELAQKMNEFADYLEKDMVNALIKTSNGDLNWEIKAKDEKDIIAPALNKLSFSIKNLVKDTLTLVESALQGNLSVRVDDKNYEGEFNKIVKGLNKTLDNVVEPINDVSHVMERVASKDLTVRIEKDYKGDFNKLKVAINTSLSNLEEVIKQVLYATEQVSAAAAQISSGAQGLAQAASEQASSIEEITSSIQELSSMSKQNAGNAKEGRAMSEKAKEMSEEGLDGMKRLSEAIEKIKKSSDDTAKILKTIDEIAFQTNLLALNAAVEAARAGEAGKGFAVVAEEVRNLAMRSAEAAKNTANLIEEALKNAESGVSLNDDVKKKLEEIANQSVKVSQIVSEIAAASEQQEQGVEQINSGVQQLNQITQSNAANSEESASASEELSGQAQELMRMISEFKTSAKIEKKTKPNYSKNSISPKAPTKDVEKIIPMEDNEPVLKTF